MKKILEWLFSFHSKNKDTDYVQGWYCWPKWLSRWGGLGYKARWDGDLFIEGKVNPIFIAKTHICGFLTGHEISKTEWGYGGGDHVDCNCRWCDEVIQVTPEQARFMFPVFNEWGRHEKFQKEAKGQ